MSDQRQGDSVNTSPEQPWVRQLGRGFMPMALAIPLWVLEGVYLAIAFVSASSQAKASATDAIFLKDLLGMPLLEGFRNADRFGVHVKWGTLALLVAPLIIALLLSVVSAARSRRSHQ